MFSSHHKYLIFLALLIASCNPNAIDDPQPTPPEPTPVADAPRLVSCTPESGARDIEDLELTVTMNFSEDVICSADASGRMSASAGAEISDVCASGSTVSIRFSPLDQGTSYTLTIPEGIVSGRHGNPCPALKYRFSTKVLDVADESVVLDPMPQLTNPNATKEARNVYRFLLEQNGKKIISGVQSDGPGNFDTNASTVLRYSGRYPAMVGWDFIFLHYSPTPAGWTWIVDYGDMSNIIDHWNDHGLVSYMWHWTVPSTPEEWEMGKNYDFSKYGFYSSDTSFSIENALTEGTWEHELIMQDIAKVAGYLQILQDAGVPVIWRPLHEAAGNYDLYGGNGAWFWWGTGGPEHCKKLFRLMRDKFENEYGLNNLIWVWTHQATGGAEEHWKEWYPGDEYVDIVGVDIYAENTGARNFEYESAVRLTGGKKLVTISECGNMSAPAVLFAARNKWSWFHTWSTSYSDFKCNTPDHWSKVMNSSLVITREDMPSLK